MGVVYRIPAYTDTLLPILPKTIMYRTNETLKQCISTPIQRWGGNGSSFIHYPNGEIQELTGSPLYHTATIINSNIHSGGVSLQQTKEERYTIISCNFFS